MNVILVPEVRGIRHPWQQRHSQMRINPWDTSLFDLARERREPALRTPHIRVLAPQCRVAVRRWDLDHHARAARERYGVRERAVAQAHWLRER